MSSRGKNTNGLGRELVAATAGIGTLVGITALIPGFPFVIAAAGAVGIYTGTRLLFTSVDHRFVNLPPKVKADVEDILELIAVIEAQQRQVDDHLVDAKLTEITKLGKEIVKVLVEQESAYSRIPEVEKIFTSVSDILGRYLKLKAHAVLSTEINQTQEKLVALLGSLTSALKDYYRKAVAGDLLDLDVDMKVLKRILDSKTEI